MPYENYSIAVLLPCFNEERSIGQVITDFRQALPHAAIYVCDNNSTDATAEAARKAGAILRREPLKGKGNALRRMMADIDADIYVLADGDGQHDAKDALSLIEVLTKDRLDMAVGVRAEEERRQQRYHASGNRLFNAMAGFLFGQGISDILSGYRALSKRFVKSFPAASRGYEIETELSVHALELRLPFAEVPITCRPRVDGSCSKLHTWKDGWRILATFVRLFKEARPFALFTWIAILLSLLAFLLGWPLVMTFLETSTVPRIPTAIIVVGLLVFAFVSFASGVILDGVAQARRENKRLHYLNLKGLP